MIHQRQRAGVKNKNQSHRCSSFKCARAFSRRPNVPRQPRMPRFSVPIRFVFSVCVPCFVQKRGFERKLYFPYNYNEIHL